MSAALEAHPQDPRPDVAPAEQQAGEQIDRELEAILTSFDTSYVWNYGCVKDGLRDLYEKSKREQWNGADLAWSTPVEPEQEILPAELNPLQGYAPFERLNDREKSRFNHAQISWQLSQFMHGEQGAMIVASQLVGAVPWMDAKLYASSQTMDEARHVEVFSRYLHEKLEWEWPINPSLKKLLDAIILDSRWDFKYLGMQVLVEGLAMAAFANLHQLAVEPLVKDLVYNVMRDESRHVAFGVLSLRGFYDELPKNELRDREDFVSEACRLMRDRLIGEEVSEYMGFPAVDVRQVLLQSPILQLFRQQLFSRVVPNLKRLGLLTPYVRTAFEEMAILQFEDLNPDEADRALGLA
jgi:hypothetical protein